MRYCSSALQRGQLVLYTPGSKQTNGRSWSTHQYQVSHLVLQSLLATKLDLIHISGVEQDTAKRLCAPADIEVHIGTDGRIYVLDFARVFPPTGISVSVFH